VHAARVLFFVEMLLTGGKQAAFRPTFTEPSNAKNGAHWKVVIASATPIVETRTTLTDKTQTLELPCAFVDFLVTLVAFWLGFLLAAFSLTAGPL
jgi:hypothetical protein